MNIIGKKNLYFAISLIVIIPGIISLVFFGLNLSIDFTGGSRIQVQSAKFNPSTGSGQSSNDVLRKIFIDQKVPINSLQKTGDDAYIIRTKTIDQKTHDKILHDLKKKFQDVKEISFETVGPTIGSETTANAVKAVIFASFLIVLYIAWSFRKVPKPASSFRFGICAIAALLHDVTVIIGIFSLLGYFLKVEIDSLFVTALLTIIGFSVHDTIVVFDRVRENLRRMPNMPFSKVVNESILQTLGRSLNTSLTVVLVLFTLLLFGGESTKWLVAALLIGIISGTYSSIFNAAPLLVVWEEWNRKNQRSEIKDQK